MADKGQAMQALARAIDNHDQVLLGIALAEGADVNGRMKHPSPFPIHAALHEVIDGANIELVTLMVSAGADVNQPDDQGSTPISIAVNEESIMLAQILLDAGSDPNVRSGEGELPLHRAVENGDLAMCKLLLEYGATESINEWSALSGLTPLGMAAKRLDLSLIQFLVGAGALLAAKDDDYKVARQRLPERTAENQDDWDAASGLLE